MQLGTTMRIGVKTLLLAAAALLATTAWAADDDWSKVVAIRSGTEIRVARKGKPQPVIGKMDEAREDVLVLVVKNEQIAIPKDEVERVEARPAKTKAVKTETTNTQPAYDAPAGPNQPTRPSGPSGSTSSSMTFSKGEFETVYRKRPGQQR